jgi:ribose 5-phosphate isomerase RpiB
MKIAVINEISAADKNADILKALDGRGHEVLNLGNTAAGQTPGLLYIHTGLMSALLLHLKAVDFVVGGCGTGQGFLNAVMQYPGVSCGHLLTPLDAWLFARINAGNCVSLALNQGYGWAGDVNLRLLFDALFTPEAGKGYPSHRAEPQRQGRALLERVSAAAHRPMAEVLLSLPEEVIRPAVTFPAYRPVLEQAVKQDPGVSRALSRYLGSSPGRD